MELVHSSYYGQSFTLEFLEEAMDYYLQWCKANNQTPEIDEDMGVDQLIDNDALTDHVLYHAEIQGLKIEEGEADES